MMLHVREGTSPASARVVAALTVAILAILFASAVRAEDDSLYGPRFEMGGGIGISSMSVQPEWVPESDKTGMITASMRLYKGLSVQGGIDWSRGGNPHSKSISSGDYLIRINEGTFSTSQWAGLRYELPMSVLKRDILAINSFYCAGGLNWSGYGVRSTEWKKDGEQHTADEIRGFTLADINGSYAAIAARWRIDNPESNGITDSWLGAYGIDFGVKYIRYHDTTLAEANVAEVPDDFAKIQFFLVGFLKFRFFE